MGSRPGLSRFLTGVVILAVAVGLAFVAVDQLRPARPDTFIVGDSVTYMSDQAIHHDLGGANVEIRAQPGFRTQDLLPLALADLAVPGTPASRRDRAVFL